jgi:methylmalonyl-CoA epimerase
VIKAVHHIGIGVRDLGEMTRLYQRLGLELTGTVAWPGLKAALLPAGDVLLELIEPTAPETAVGESLARLVDERAGGVHHICFEVDDIEAAVDVLRSDGVEMIEPAPQETAGGLVAWLAEGAVEGVMIELCQEGYEVK